MLQTSHDEVTHEFLLKSHVGRLATTTRTKIYQHASTPDILAAGLPVKEFANSEGITNE
ncbi:hypothetical protein [Paraburkholderia sp. J41]|uniref:hypothetical protein n=1 Tax=Paraburkholderia sp. J41 TaxID=2805433 RepID=UPI002AC35CBF|nr:hypothetical protein [Paraburkholderia sp. J41]